MKVLHYIDVTEPGGALNQVVMLLNEIQKSTMTSNERMTTVHPSDNDKVELFLLTDNHQRVRRVIQNELLDGIEVGFIDCTSPKDVKHIGLLRKHITEIKPDLIHLHLNHSGACRYAFFANKHIPIIATEHDPFPLSKLKTIIKRYTLKHTDHTIAISDQNRLFLMKQYGIPENRITTVYNGIEIEKYQTNPSRPHPGPIIGSIMELHERKGPDILIRAFKNIHDTLPEAKLFIAGDGPMKHEIKTLVKTLDLHDSVRLFGWVNDIPKFLSDIDLFLLTSRREAFGLAVLEAQAARKPVIASRTGGLQEIIDHGTTGLLCTPEQSDEFADSSIHVLNNPVQYRSFVEKAFEKLVRSFSSKHVAKKTISLYKEILTTTQ